MRTLHGRSTSFNVQKVLWFLEELALPFEHVEMGGRFGGLDSAEFARLNPMQKVPVLVDGGKAIWESHTILRYLAAEYGTGLWWHEDPFERSLADRWMDWSQVIFQPAFMGLFWGYYRKIPAQRELQQVEAYRVRCIDCLDILDSQLKNTGYLAGDKISLADVPTGAVLYRLTEMGLAIEVPKHVEQWYERLRERAGYSRWIMSDFGELEGREDF